MNDISDLASLNFEDLAQADLFDLVTSSTSQLKEEVEPEDEDMTSRTSSPVFDQEQSYTHITLINGEQICLRDEMEDEDWGTGGSSLVTDSMDLNSILQAGVVERVTSTVSNMDDLDDLDWDPEEVSSSSSLLSASSTSQTTVIRPRHTILASQLPLPVPARLRSGPGTVVISSSSLVSRSETSSNNNNSLLRSALIGKQSATSTNGSVLLSSADSPQPRTVLATVKTEGSAVGVGGQVDDILLLSLEGREAVARLKDGASQLFPNTRVTSDLVSEASSPTTTTSNTTVNTTNTSPASVISIEVDMSGNLVLHKQPPPTSDTSSEAARAAKLSHLAKVRKYQRRSNKEEPKKESRLLHYCHICNKGFKDKYSVNVHVRTHTGEKPFSCQLCGKCFRQKAHLAKHQQTHASKQGSGEHTNSSSVLHVNEAESQRF